MCVFSVHAPPLLPFSLSLIVHAAVLGSVFVFIQQLFLPFGLFFYFFFCKRRDTVFCGQTHQLFIMRNTLIVPFLS